MTDFIPHKPIADDLASTFISTIITNQKALEGGLVTDLMPGWNYLNAGPSLEIGATYDNPSHLVWQNDKTGDSVRCEITSYTGTGYDGYADTLEWSWSPAGEGAWQLIGTETVTWDVNDNPTAVSWSATSATYTDHYDIDKPVKTDVMLAVVDSIRTNFMALHDTISAGVNDLWATSFSGGTAEEPTTVTLTSDAKALTGTVTWTDGRIDAILWVATGFGAGTIGTFTVTYVDDDIDVTAWSGTSGYDFFDPALPAAGGNADDILTDVLNNMQAMIHSQVIGEMLGWDYSWSGGTRDNPQYFIWSNGAERYRVENTYGVSGFGEDCITGQILEYSDTGGTSYTTLDTVSYVYLSDGAVGTATWGSTDGPLSVTSTGLGSPLVSEGSGSVWQDDDYLGIWQDLQGDNKWWDEGSDPGTDDKWRDSEFWDDLENWSDTT